MTVIVNLFYCSVNTFFLFSIALSTTVVYTVEKDV